MAETYHVFNIGQLPLQTAAALVFGLRENSRIKMAKRGEEYTQETLMMAIMCDRIASFQYMMSDKSGDKPASIFEALTGIGKEADSDVISFESDGDFRREWDRITKGGS